MKLKERTQSMTAMAGKTTRCGDSKRWERASLSMAPQVAVGGWTPRPRKLRVASARTAAAMPTAACTMSGCKMLGRMWLEKETEVGGADRTRGLHELSLFHGHDLGAHQARVADPAGDGECKDEVDEAGSHESNERDGKENARERKEGVGDVDIDDCIGQAAEETRDAAEYQAEYERDGNDPRRRP